MTLTEYENKEAEAEIYAKALEAEIDYITAADAEYDPFNPRNFTEAVGEMSADDMAALCQCLKDDALSSKVAGILADVTRSYWRGMASAEAEIRLRGVK